MSDRTLNTALTLLVVGAMLAIMAGPHSLAFAQAPQASNTKQAPPPSLRSYLEKLQYDVGERGPLLAVAPEETVVLSRDGSDYRPGSRLSLGTLARLTERRVATIGGLTALVPLTMKLIESHPGKANPYRGMSKKTRFNSLWALLRLPNGRPHAVPRALD